MERSNKIPVVLRPRRDQPPTASRSKGLTDGLGECRDLDEINVMLHFELARKSLQYIDICPVGNPESLDGQISSVDSLEPIDPLSLGSSSLSSSNLAAATPRGLLVFLISG